MSLDESCGCQESKIKDTSLLMRLFESENNGESSRKKGFRFMGSFLDREIKQTIILSKISKGKAERNCGEILQIKKVFSTKTDEIKSSS